VGRVLTCIAACVVVVMAIAIGERSRPASGAFAPGGIAVPLPSCLYGSTGGTPGVGIVSLPAGTNVILRAGWQTNAPATPAFQVAAFLHAVRTTAAIDGTPLPEPAAYFQQATPGPNGSSLTFWTYLPRIVLSAGQTLVVQYQWTLSTSVPGGWDPDTGHPLPAGPGPLFPGNPPSCTIKAIPAAIATKSPHDPGLCASRHRISCYQDSAKIATRKAVNVWLGPILWTSLIGKVDWTKSPVAMSVRCKGVDRKGLRWSCMWVSRTHPNNGIWEGRATVIFSKYHRGSGSTYWRTTVGLSAPARPRQG
jgi:hypothetical protein